MKPQLLLLHGALGSKKQLAEIKAMLNHQFEVHDLSFEGHGGIDSEQNFSIPLFSNNVLRYMEENEINQFNIFGYSMGGYVALNTALKHPSKVNQIVTLGTKFDWTPVTAAREVKMLNPEKIEEKVPHFAKQLKEEHYPLNWKIVVNKTASMMTDLGNGACLQDEDFKRVNHKVTIGIGSLDKMVSYDESEHIANLLSNSKLVKMNDTPHPIHLMDQQKIVDYIINSLD